jgi:hypothetical protein
LGAGLVTALEQLRAIIAAVERVMDQMTPAPDEQSTWAKTHVRWQAELRAVTTLLRRIGPADGEPTYMVMSYGESDEPVFEFARDYDGVRRAIAGMVWSDPDDADHEELNNYMAIFDNPDDWSWGGTRMTIEFEIGGIEVTRIAR